MTRRPPHPRSHPGLWNQRPHRRRRSYRPAPDARLTRPKGIATAWTRIRRLIWSWWPWAILCIYYIDQHAWWWALGTGLWSGVCSLSTPQESPPQYGLDHGIEVGSQDFLDTMAGSADIPFLPGNTLKLLNNGDRFYPAMLQDIDQAERSITVEAYIYWAGEIGITFAKALAAAAQRGIKVKLLLDAVGSQSIGNEIIKILEDGGCHLAWYNPIRITRLRRINNRTHRKSLIVDGRIGYTGGAGIADHWTGDAQDDEHWRDMQIRIEGPAVRPLQSGFAHNWLECTGELVTGPDFYPTLTEVGPLAVQTIMSSPETGASSVRVMYFLAISAARKTIDIANPYFVARSRVRSTCSAMRSSEACACASWSPDRATTRTSTRLNSLRLYGALLKAGVQVFEYNRTMMHHKIMVVDGLWSTVGTTNFDNRSFSHNEENNVCVCDEGVAAELTATFERDIAVCEVVTLDGWRKRGLPLKTAEALASFVQDQV